MKLTYSYALGKITSYDLIPKQVSSIYPMIRSTGDMRALNRRLGHTGELCTEG